MRSSKNPPGQGWAKSPSAVTAEMNDFGTIFSGLDIHHRDLVRGYGRGSLGQRAFGSFPHAAHDAENQVLRMSFNEEGVFLLSQGRFDEHIPQLRLQAGMEMIFRLFNEDGFSLGDDALDDHRQDLAEAEADIGEADVDAGGLGPVRFPIRLGNRHP